MLRNLSFLFIFLFIQTTIFGQDSIVVYYNRDFHGQRPKLGLVLSGGGAKGIAHVGVLRIMDRVGLKPDYITGTSMGSIVGGLYAIGYSPDSLEELIDKQDWTEVLSNKLNLLNVNMEEKWDYGEYIAEFPFSGWKPSLPAGAIKGQELELLFNKLTISVASDTNFDDFYIPFRAVAVDILTGEPYVFKSGNLALAMRSSMSIPTIMDPVKYRGMLLVDGGLVNNFPVNVCKEMGADIIIGVYTGGELMPEEKLNSLFNILKQSSLLAGIKNAEKQRENVDLYIEPYLSDLSSADFNNATTISDRGYQAASRKFADFKKMALFFEQFPENEKPLPNLADSVFVVDKKFNIEGSSTLNEKIIHNAFDDSETAKWLKSNDIKSQIDNIYGTRLFKKITYEYIPVPNNDSALVLNYNIQKDNDKYLTLAFQYKSESSFGLNIGFKYRNFLIRGSKLDVKFRLSDYPALRFRYFTYVGYKIKNGLALNYDYKTNSLIFYDGVSRVGDYRMNYGNFGFTYYHYLNLKSEYYLGVAKRRIAYHKNIDIDNLYFKDILSLSNNFIVGFKRNTLDKKYFSDRGSELVVGGSLYWRNYNIYYYEPDSLVFNPELPSSVTDTNKSIIRFRLGYNVFSKISSKLVLENNFNILASLNADYNTLNSHWVGGVNVDDRYQYAFWGLPENYDLFNNGWIYRIGLRYNFYDKLYISAKANLMFSAVDITKIFDSSNDQDAIDSYVGYYDNYLFGSGLQLSYESMIGPVSVTVTKASNSSKYWWHVLFGYRF
jgi:NTE family protein